ncbi:MAG: hypothetical protein RIC16_14765 [Rhodospirillales bacterium]
MRKLSVFAAALFAVTIMAAPAVSYSGCTTTHTADAQSTMTSDATTSTGTVVVGTDGD